MTAYAQQSEWRAIQEFLPAEYRLTPDTEPDKVAEQMVAVSDVLLVSHNPLVGNLLSYLQHGAGHPPERVSTAGLAELESNELLVGSMRLNDIKHP